ncbi:hypothetical protein N7517_002615 [Penicillium concentricum]|uniref:Uncharacterized protein n=1 Tax=Penicillium concentricum TaxID=293559 RepID=A0A9W9SVU0_9EURO|nr:uncharacterized protein N7517_002615 [Penicillium concentricum]KAJ5384704.1 hypothetical protein N7517_002615 [Penicillium concentricum]
MALSFSSLPLLSYLSYELILIGYLPKYRIILVGLSIAILVCSNFLVTRHVQRQKELNDSSSPDFSQGARSAGSSMKPGQYLSQYLPAAIPLLQGIVIGGLQDWGLSSSSGLENRTMGIILGRMKQIRQKGDFTRLSDSGSSESSRRSSLPFNAFENSTSSFPSTPTYERYHITDYSAFYRQPRYHYKDPPNRASALDNSHEKTAENPCSDSHPSDSFQDSFDEFMDVPIRPNVDYSTRESDLFYGKLGNGFASPVPISQALPQESQESRNTLREWAVRAAGTLNPSKKKKKEKGFQVMRPPR